MRENHHDISGPGPWPPQDTVRLQLGEVDVPGLGDGFAMVEVVADVRLPALMSWGVCDGEVIDSRLSTEPPSVLTQLDPEQVASFERLAAERLENYLIEQLPETPEDHVG